VPERHEHAGANQRRDGVQGAGRLGRQGDDARRIARPGQPRGVGWPDVLAGMGTRGPAEHRVDDLPRGLDGVLPGEQPPLVVERGADQPVVVRLCGVCRLEDLELAVDRGHAGAGSTAGSNRGVPGRRSRPQITACSSIGPLDRVSRPTTTRPAPKAATRAPLFILLWLPNVIGGMLLPVILVAQLALNPLQPVARLLVERIEPLQPRLHEGVPPLAREHEQTAVEPLRDHRALRESSAELGGEGEAVLGIKSLCVLAQQHRVELPSRPPLPHPSPQCN